jgi:hypothetical protein
MGAALRAAGAENGPAGRAAGAWGGTGRVLSLAVARSISVADLLAVAVVIASHCGWHDVHGVPRSMWESHPRVPLDIYPPGGGAELPCLLRLILVLLFDEDLGC